MSKPNHVHHVAGDAVLASRSRSFISRPARLTDLRFVNSRLYDLAPSRFEDPSMHQYSRDNSLEACAPNGNACANDLPDAERMVAESVRLFGAETGREVGDRVIARFRAALKSVQASELERLYHRLPELDERSRQAIHHFADCVVAKMLDPPMESLRHASRNGSQHGLLEALQRLFQLQEV
jgi:glutamyl-tRNA reductase